MARGYVTDKTSQPQHNKALHPTAYSSVRRASSLRFRRWVSLALGCGARLGWNNRTFDIIGCMREKKHDLGKIILLNGTSSSGKSTLARALQSQIDQPFWHFSIDHLIRENSGLPLQRIEAGDFQWKDMRPRFFEGFHNCLPALAKAGNNLIVEHIVETAEWMNQLLHLLQPFDVFFVGIHCPLVELEARELKRGDRKIGEARMDYDIIHTFGFYDFEISSIASVEKNVSSVVAAWQNRKSPSAFEKMLAKS